MGLPVKPLEEFYYPDRGGYRGFSVCIWEHNDLENVIFSNHWGGFSPSRVFDGIKWKGCGLEGRLFVYGKLVSHVLESENFSRLKKIQKNLSGLWVVIIDEIMEKENFLYKEPERHGIHIDEILSPDLQSKIDGIPYEQRIGR